MSRVQRWWPWARDPTGETHETCKRGKEIVRFVTSGPESGLPGRTSTESTWIVSPRTSCGTRHCVTRRTSSPRPSRSRGASGSNVWTTRCRGSSSRRATSRGRSGARRSARARSLLDLIDLIETSSPSAEITALRRAEITDALAGLDELSREALLLTTWDGLSGIDAARVLGITPGALRVRVHRARTTMKEMSVHD